MINLFFKVPNEQIIFQILKDVTLFGEARYFYCVPIAAANIHDLELGRTYATYEIDRSKILPYKTIEEIVGYALLQDWHVRK